MMKGTEILSDRFREYCGSPENETRCQQGINLHTKETNSHNKQRN
jgi:hypothetical protein